MPICQFQFKFDKSWASLYIYILGVKWGIMKYLCLYIGTKRSQHDEKLFRIGAQLSEIEYI